jgi:hypothetical protein
MYKRSRDGDKTKKKDKNIALHNRMSKDTRYQNSRRGDTKKIRN